MDIAGNIRAAVTNCGKAEEPAPVTEPTIVPTAFITGGIVEVTDTCVRFIGWEQLPSIGGEMVERRIAVRLAMSNDCARDLVANWRNALTRGGH